MTTLTLPHAPAGIQAMRAIQGADVLGAWLFDVARKCGEPALDHAIGAGWPGTTEQRKHLAPGHIEKARNEARQVASETWAKEATARGTWGV